MPVTLLATKLHFPRRRHGLVPRPRLTHILEKGLQGPLTVISAPAGSGKTTLMSEWRSSSVDQVPVAWLSLDAEDNDPLHFLTYLTAAVEAASPHLTGSLFSLLQSPQPAPLEPLFTLFLEALSNLTSDLILVLDDYHVIMNTLVHNTLNRLLSHVPPGLHLVILTRADPPLPLARLRARNELVEIRANDLRFTLEEAAAFVDQTMGLSLSPEQVAALEARTEGWVVGLQLAALSIRQQPDEQSFISSFTGSHHYIVDYLIEEVLNRQPESIQAFLLETSVLDRMNAALCNAVTGKPDGQHMLECLERNNLFVVPLDEERGWYRYQHLFADQLRICLGRLRGAEVASLQRRASEWCAQQGLVEEAVTYALRAGSFENAAQLIEGYALSLSGQGRIATLLNWIGALPEPILAKRPRLRLSLAWALFLAYKVDQAETCVHQVEQSLPPEAGPVVWGELALWHGIIARRNADLDRSREYLLQALEQLPVENKALRGRACIFLGMVYLESDVTRARDIFLEAVEVFEAENMMPGVLTARYFLAWTERLQGRLGQACATYQRALPLVEQIPRWPVVSYVHLSAAEMLYEQNELAHAMQHIVKATELAEVGGHRDNLFNAAFDAARIQRGLRNWEAAEKFLAQAEEGAVATIPWVRVRLINERVSLYLAQGQLQEAREWLQHNPYPPKGQSPISLLYEQILWARVHICPEEADDVLAQLPKMLVEVQQLGLVPWQIQLLCLQSLAFQAQGRTAKALVSLKSAFALAEPEGQIQVFLEEGPRLLELIRLAQKRKLAPGFVDRLMAAFTGQSAAEVLPAGPTRGPLSKREIELLRLVAEGCSNKEIAERLVISIGTVKRHTVNIFHKLDVKNRTEAVARARERKLL